MTQPSGYHHLAFACRDVDATYQFYNDLLGFPLAYTDIQHLRKDGTGLVRHFFFDVGNGSYIGFFEIDRVGERDNWRTDISTGLGLPVWVNHVAFRADPQRVDETKARMAAAGIEPLYVMEHGFVTSTYFLDPNGIMVELSVDDTPFTHDHDTAYALLHGTEANKVTHIAQQREHVPLPT
jgi:catechol 2,3-dioxygenase-like lactoylglutathione lyase family enzyme